MSVRGYPARGYMDQEGYACLLCQRRDNLRSSAQLPHGAASNYVVRCMENVVLANARCHLTAAAQFL